MSIFESKKRFTISCIIVLILAVGLAYAHTNGGIELAKEDLGRMENTENASPPAQSASLTPPGLNPDTIATMVEQAGPAVVKIETTSEVRNPYGNSPFNDPFFRYFFGDSFNAPESRVTQGLGSGFIISQDGYVLTNEHVIARATDIQVVVSGYEKSFPAQVIGKDGNII